MIYEYKCIECSDVTEDIRSMQDRDKLGICKLCGADTKKIMSATRSTLDPISGDFPKATNRWESNRNSHMRQEKKNMDNHGSYT